MGRSVLLVGIDPVDVFAYGPQALSALRGGGARAEVVVSPYFQPSPSYWDILERGGGGLLAIAGLTACSVTLRFMRAALQRFDGLRLYPPLACGRPLESRASRAGGGVTVEPLRVWEFWKSALPGGVKASLWRMTRYAAAYGDWGALRATLASIVAGLAEDAGSEEVDRARHIERLKATLNSVAPATPGAAASKYMNAYMTEERIDDSFEVYRITRRPGPRLPFTPVVANLRAKSAGKTVVIYMPDVNLNYFALSPPRRRGSWNTTTALREAARRGVIQAKIHVESPEYAEGLAVIPRR